MLFFKKKIIWYLIILAGVFTVILVGCDRVVRHRVLTFFFEGVPPLDSDTRASASETAGDKSPTTTGAIKKLLRMSKQTDASSHKPAKDCQRCHLENTRWNRKQLFRPLPDLCYSCHTNYYEVSGYLHGPIAVGACLFCHDPHGTKYKSLQKAPQPELCYQCHQQEDIESIEGHQDMQKVVCTECHDPHISSTRKLLKPYINTETINDPNFVKLDDNIDLSK